MSAAAADVERSGSLKKRGKGSNGVYPVSPPPPQEEPTTTIMAVDPKKRTTWLTWLIPLFVLANVVMFVVAMYKNNCPAHTGGDRCIATWLKRFSFQPWRENPLLGPSSQTLHDLGALDTRLVVDKRQGWRLVTCMWLHAGLFHLLANMLGLLFIGLRLEQEFGFLRIGLVYLLSGLGGSLLSSLFNRHLISVGASGALFGLLGATLAELVTNWSIYTRRCTALFSLLFIVAINLAFGLMPYVDNFAHLGGFFSGLLLGFVLLLRPQFGYKRDAAPGDSVKPKHKSYQYALWIAAAVLLVAGFTAAIVTLFKGVDPNKGCRWCHYLSCVPTSRWSCDR